MALFKKLSPEEELIRRRHPLYGKYLAEWELLRKAYEGGNEWKKTALDPYSTSELYGNYADRLRRAVGSNHVKHVIAEKRNILFRQGVHRDVVSGDKPPLWEAFNVNIDGRGTERDDFFRRVYTIGTLYSWVLILVDKALTAESVEDAIAQRAYPYCAVFPPQAVLDWSVDRYGKLRWVLLRESSRVDGDPWQKDENKVLESYLLWTQDYWQRIQALADAPASRNTASYAEPYARLVAYDLGRKRKIIGKTERNENPLGEVPVVIYRDGEHPTDMIVGDNNMTEIADFSRGWLNQRSNLDEQIYNTVFRFLAIIGGEAKKSKQKVGSRVAIHLPPGGDIKWVDAGASAADAIMKLLNDDERSIYLKAKLRSGYGEEKRPERMSGIAHNWDWRITGDDIADDARVMEKCELEVDRLFGLWEKMNGFKTVVNYPRNFSVTSAQEQLLLWQGLNQTPLSPTAMAELHKRTVENLLPRMDEAKKKKILAEIEETPQPTPPAARNPLLPRGLGLNKKLAEKKQAANETPAQA